jgi:hypothetical protein
MKKMLSIITMLISLIGCTNVVNSNIKAGLDNKMPSNNYIIDSQWDGIFEKIHNGSTVDLQWNYIVKKYHNDK